MNTNKLFTYFSEEYFVQEQQKIFSHAPQYIGHKLMCPYPNDYKSLEAFNHGYLLHNQGGQYNLLSNICRHRQAIMLKGQGNSEDIFCDLHKWRYNNKGELINAPLFRDLPKCKNLTCESLTSWNGLLFKSNRDIANDLKEFTKYKWFDFTNYQYSNTLIHDYDFNWKTFIEVYSEDYHVDTFHPGLGNFVDCDSLDWYFGLWYHCQFLPTKSQLSKPGSKLYQNWHKKVLEVHGKHPDFGAIWLTYYPNIMIECYPKTIVVAVIVPISAQKTRLVTEFYYPDEILGFDPEYVALQQKVYMETAREDDEICYRMHEGRKLLYQAGIEDNGPYQHPTETGLEHFHDFLIREMQ